MGLNPLGFEDGKRFSAGFLAGFMVRFLTQPFDVLKIRFQLQVEPIKRRSGSYYCSLPQAFGRILKEEGLTAFWKGHVPGQLLSMTFCGVEFAVFYGLSTLPSTELQDKQSHSAHHDLLYGIVAGTVATTCCQPLDVMRTRLVAQGRHKVYSGVVRGFIDLVRNEGILALWRGLGPSCMLIAPQTAITFAVYEKIKRSYVTYVIAADGSTIPRSLSLVAGCASGLVAKTAIYPLDLIKKRLAVRGFETARQGFGQIPTQYTASSYKLPLNGSRRTFSRTQFYASWACLRGILAQEGPLGLFKGWTPSALKATLSTGLTFFFFEQFYQLLNKQTHI
ncbi:Mitochondrial thiamine pyrophosphate carrier [Paragonimus heterotremus]|uniref:Mitochondrial thiamine pyrophosphate carrier n=1 Tax=Paragonimus heterotremus TaxID=100268 RepID=A0A8J4TDR4_9TREM|nr:Mitochondrial thiamine pyrophosphate carrier [Paragonimus heterotremus]